MYSVGMIYLLMLLLFCLGFWLGKKVISKDPPISAEKQESSREVISPQITVVFQQDLLNDEDLCKEIADMYLSNRAFYYSGRQPPALSEKEEEEEVFVYFDNIDFSKLQKIEV